MSWPTFTPFHPSSHQEEKQKDATTNLSSTHNYILFSKFIYAYFDFGFQRASVCRGFCSILELERETNETWVRFLKEGEQL